MSKTRHILAVVAVTTALCADRAVTAAPMARPQVGQMAARLVERLSRPFRQTVAAVLRTPTRQLHSGTPQRPGPIRVPALALHRDYSPFQFRLPPPVL